MDSSTDFRKRSDWLWVLAISTLAFLIPFLIFDRFYFWDDKQHQYMPVIYDIGRSLRDFELPWLSLNSWWGGNYLIEYQYGVLNPVNLLVFFAVADIQDLHLSAMLVVAPFMLILGLGSYALLSQLGCQRNMALFGVAAITTNNYLLYWASSSWVPSFWSFSWLPLAWYFLLKARGNAYHGIAAIASIYMLITSGWPQGDVIFGILCLALLIQASLIDRDVNYSLRLVLIYLAGGLLALPSVLPLAFALEGSAREVMLVQDDFLVPALSDVLNFGFPTFQPYIHLWQGVQRVSAPIFYAGWALPLLLFFIDWGKVNIRQPNVLLFTVILSLTLWLTIAPSQLGPLRWSFRYLPYLHLFLTVALLSLAFSDDRLLVTARRVRLALWYCVAAFLVSIANSASIFDLYIGVILGLLTLLAAQLLKRSLTAASVLFVASTLLIFTVTHVIDRSNRNIPDWGYPRYVEESDDKIEGYTFYAVPGNTWDQEPGRLNEYTTGTMHLLGGEKALNGYSPVGHKRMAERLCLNLFTFSCIQVVNKLFARDESTQLSFARLFGLSRLVLHVKFLPKNDSSIDTKTWRIASQGQYTVTYERTGPATDYCGTLAFVSNEARVLGCDGADSGSVSERFRLSTGEQEEATTLVFSRLFWKGYRISWNGQPLEPYSHDGIFLAVKLPAFSGDGVLQIEYGYPFPRIAAALAAGGLLLTVLLPVLFRKRRSATAKPSETRVTGVT